MSFRTINPATGALVQTFSKISDADLEIAIDGAYSCFQTDWRHRTVAERADTMRAAAAELLAHADDYAGYVTLEMGKLIRAARAEVSLSASILDYYATHADAFLAPKALPQSPGAVVETQPLGVILGIEPWNFPYYQVARVAGPQLMAGNVVIIKHALVNVAPPGGAAVWPGARLTWRSPSVKQPGRILTGADEAAPDADQRRALRG